MAATPPDAGFLDRLAASLDVPPLADDEVDRLLDLARVVAHGTERRFAPLAAFLAGVAVGRGRDLADAAAATEAVLG